MNNSENNSNSTTVTKKVKSWWFHKSVKNKTTLENVKLISLDKRNKKSQQNKNMSSHKVDKWSEQRFEVVQMMWGVGARQPGDNNFEKVIFKSHKLHSKIKVLDLSVGLGKSARLLVNNHFMNVDGIECNSQILDKCRVLNDNFDVTQYIKLLDFDLENIKLSKMSYDFIYSREKLHLMKCKKSILKNCSEALRAKGKIVFTDFILTEERHKDELLEKWTEIEKHTLYPVTKDFYYKNFQNMRLKYIPPYDLSKQYIMQVYDGWKRTKENFRIQPPSKEIMEITEFEIKLWQSRVDAILAGQMKLLLFQVVK